MRTPSSLWSLEGGKGNVVIPSFFSARPLPQPRLFLRSRPRLLIPPSSEAWDLTQRGLASSVCRAPEQLPGAPNPILSPIRKIAATTQPRPDPWHLSFEVPRAGCMAWGFGGEEGRRRRQHNRTQETA